jgi:flagellar biosynthesis component FlhA
MFIVIRYGNKFSESRGKITQQAGMPPVVMCAPQIRLGFRRFFETAFAELTVLSYAEISPRVDIQNAGILPCPESV